ncbi:hypothetical protein B7486_13425 [cyanobacterium TDX16]|nr:hypothetical protein B7486_13425 [cyanobacterium TDX16]
MDTLDSGRPRPEAIGPSFTGPSWLAAPRPDAVKQRDQDDATARVTTFPSNSQLIWGCDCA